MATASQKLATALAPKKNKNQKTAVLSASKIFKATNLEVSALELFVRDFLEYSHPCWLSVMYDPQKIDMNNVAIVAASEAFKNPCGEAVDFAVCFISRTIKARVHPATFDQLYS